MPLLHLIYRAAFLESKDADAFLDSLETDEKVKALILKYYSDSKLLPYLLDFPDHLTKLLMGGGDSGWTYHVQGLKKLLDTKCFLSDTDSYAHIRNMYLEDKIKISFGANNNPKVFRKITEEANSIGVSVKNVYLSNSHWAKYINPCKFST
jgi:hypothetical protein